MANKRIIIDTSILIDYFRKQDKEKTALIKLAKSYDLSISAITEFEWLVGFKDDLLTFGKEIIKNIEIINFDSKSAEKAREIFNKLKKKNKLIDIKDILIASACLSNNLPIATFNKEHFERIEDIELIKF